ncbi:BTAD domain-containing putative transcriptional regulator [Nocardia sp. NPDC058058]|uniref:BTAD domain-containing putative transcriptional regulator n=1 Tax=Nocardia sp. NPDC058058 TaxID=3346317 RepID=UPI0036D9495B
MRVALLGPLAIVSADEVTVPVGGPRVRALLAMLALEPGRVVSTGRLIDGIWGEHPPAGSVNALQSLVKRLRAVIAPMHAIETRTAGYILTLPADAVDAALFTRLAAEGTWQLEHDRAEHAAALLDSALGLWRGTALSDLSAFTVFESATAALIEQRLTAIETRAQAYLSLGRAGELIQQLTQETAAHPYRETLAACLVRALAAAGRPAEAMRAYERTRHLLDSELAADPGRALTDVLREIHSAPVQPAAAQGSAQLRIRRTSFVGRDDDIARLDRMLTSNALITLVGPGGAGKTRLAEEIATRVAARFSHGAQLIELAGVHNPSLVGNAVLAALAVPANRDAAEPDPIAQLCSVLIGKRLLLIIDNCEHLTAATAQLVDAVLRRCPTLTILATSREPLGIAGEQLYPVTSLALPTGQHAAAPAAVQLFIDRARAVQPKFALTEENREAVGGIVRRLDGLPLAIELAAARIRTLSPGAILERLDDRFLLLTNGYRTEADRHRTLHAVVDWSWRLLDDTERELACRFSVFAGGATLDAIERVCGADLGTLAALVDKSLIEFDGARYRMLETIRAYTAAELTATGERAALERAHAHYVLALVEGAEPALRTTRQCEWVNRLTIEHDNCVAALGWAVRTADIDLSLRLCGSLVWYWSLRGFRAESAHWRAQVLALTGPPPPGSAADYLACAYADLLPAHYDILWWGPTDDHGDLDRLVRTATTEQRQPNPAFVLMLAVRRGRDGDLAPLNDAVRSTDPWLAANARLRRGLETLAGTQSDTAVSDLERALAELRTIGEPRGLVRALLILAKYRTGTLGLPAAVPLLTEAAELTRTWLGTDEVVGVRAWLGQLRVWHGDVTAAAAETAAARVRLDATVSAFTRTWLGVVEAEIACRRGELGAAVELFRDALDPLTRYHPLSNRPVEGIAISVEIWGRVAYALALVDNGDRHRARTELTTAFELERQMIGGNPPLLFGIAVGYASVALADGDLELAVTIIAAHDRLHPGPHRRPGPRRIIETARAQLDTAAFNRALSTGHALSFDELRALLIGCRADGSQNMAPLARIV